MRKVENLSLSNLFAGKFCFVDIEDFEYHVKLYYKFCEIEGHLLVIILCEIMLFFYAQNVIIL